MEPYIGSIQGSLRKETGFFLFVSDFGMRPEFESMVTHDAYLASQSPTTKIGKTLHLPLSFYSEE